MPLCINEVLIRNHTSVFIEGKCSVKSNLNLFSATRSDAVYFFFNGKDHTSSHYRNPEIFHMGELLSHLIIGC